MDLRNFVKVLLTAIATIFLKRPVEDAIRVARPRSFHFDGVEDFAARDIDRIRGNICKALSRKSPWITLL